MPGSSSSTAATRSTPWPTTSPRSPSRAATALGVDKSRRFSGLSGYKRVIDSGVEAVALEDIPYFYPEQAKAAVEAGCHVYMAKPIAVDVPGCLAIEAAGKRATQKNRCFLVDYQIPTDPPNIEVANRIRDGALGPLGHIHLLRPGLQAWADPPKGPTIESRLRGEIWLSDIALGGDDIVSYDIHIIDGVIWVMGKRPVAACGRSRICRPNPHGDRTDCGGVVYEYDDGVDLDPHDPVARQQLRHRRRSRPASSARGHGPHSVRRQGLRPRRAEALRRARVGSIYDDGVTATSPTSTATSSRGISRTRPSAGRGRHADRHPRPRGRRPPPLHDHG